MRTPYPEIRRSFDARLLELLPHLGLEPRAVAWPNSAFTPNADELYLRPWCLFGETATVSLGPAGYERLRGVYQVSVFDVAGSGMERAETVARAVVDHFRGGTRLDCQGFDPRITTAYAGTAMHENGRLHIPVSAVWVCDTQK